MDEFLDASLQTNRVFLATIRDDGPEERSRLHFRQLMLVKIKPSVVHRPEFFQAAGRISQILALKRLGKRRKTDILAEIAGRTKFRGSNYSGHLVFRDGSRAVFLPELGDWFPRPGIWSENVFAGLQAAGRRADPGTWTQGACSCDLSRDALRVRGGELARMRASLSAAVNSGVALGG